MDKYINTKNNTNHPNDNKPSTLIQNNEIYLWSDKYKPKNIEEMVGNSKNIEIINNWIIDFKEKKDNVKRALFIYGAPGIGKTTIAHLILKKFNYEIIEFNASDVRSQKSVRDNLIKSLNTLNVSLMKDSTIRPIGIIMDEVDGMSSGDRGGVSELVNIINPTKGQRRKKKIEKKYINPIICICNNNTEKKLSDLKKICLEVHFKKPSENDLMKIAKHIVKNEKMNIELDALQLITKFSQNDVRRLTFLLQDAYNTIQNKIITTENIQKLYLSFSKKNLDIGLFESTNKLLNNYKTFQDTMLLYESDKSLMAMMLHENFIKTIQLDRKNKDKDKLENIYQIIHNLSIGDIIDKYIYNNQYWGLQEYNGVIKCALPSKIINNMNKNICIKHEPVFTSLLSKSALQYGNQKNFIAIKNKLQIDKKYVLYANEIILKEIFNKNSENLQQKAIYRLLAFNMDISDLEKIIKLNKIEKTNEYKKAYTTKNKNKYKKLYQKIYNSQII